MGGKVYPLGDVGVVLAVGVEEGATTPGRQSLPRSISGAEKREIGALKAAGIEEGL